MVVIKMIEKLFVFYMTGTGNSYKVAMWFAEVARSMGLQTGVQQIKTEKLCFGPDEKSLCVFTLPTHGFTAPWLVIKRILQLPRANGASAVVLATRAGTRINGIALPGMEGTAGYLTAFLLFLKGYKVKGVMGIDMPSNWTAVHWGLSKENAEFIISAAEPKVKEIAEIILLGQVYFRGFIPLVLGLLLGPISFMYLIMAQLILSKLFFASDKCVSCGLCSTICPTKAIKMTGKIKKRPYWSYSCDSCMACMNYCPHQAIEASPILAIVFYYITTVPAAIYLQGCIFNGYLDWLPINWVGIVQYVFVLISVYLAYILIHQVMGWRLFSMIFSRLSHTHYLRRYHAPDVTIKEINNR